MAPPGISRLTPEQRSLRSRLAANALHAKVDSKEHIRPAREAFMARFEREVDPNGELPPAERRRRADAALRSHMQRLALKSSIARQKRSKAAS